MKSQIHASKPKMHAGKWCLMIILGAMIWVGCDEHTASDQFNEGEVTRRITAPKVQDTLYVGQPFRLIAGVECHNPLRGVRVDITDGTEAGPYGDGEIVYTKLLHTPGGPLVVDIDTTLTLSQFSGVNPDRQYSFYLVEVYEDEGREYRNGFSPIVILEQGQ